MQTPTSTSIFARRAWLGGALLVSLVALFLRAWGADWSLPYVDHPDEPAVVNQVLRMVEGDLSPKTFFYPTLMKYLLALLFQIHFWWGSTTGLYAAPLDLPRTTDFFTTLPAAYTWGRLLTAALGTGAVVALATWAVRFVGRRAALIGAALLALSPWAIDHSHFIAVDIPAATTGTLALLAALKLLHNGSWRNYLLAGALIGLAAGTKYQNALVAVPVMLAHGLSWWRTSQGRHIGIAPRYFVRLAGAGLLSIALFLLTSPYIVLDFAAFSRDFRTLISSYGGEHGDITGLWPIRDYVEFIWETGLRPLPFLLLLVGTGTLARRDPATLAVLLAFPLVLLITLLRLETHFFRNYLPAQPALLLLAGVGAVTLWEGVRRYLPARLVYPAAAVGLALLLGPLLPLAIRHSAAFAAPDSRVAAQEWIRREWPGARVASELSHPLRWDGVTQSAYAHYLPLHTPAWYRQQGYALLLASSDKRHRWHWTPDYAPLLAAGEVSATFGGEQSAYRGPRIDIIATGLTTKTLPTSLPDIMLGPLRLRDVRVGHLINPETGPELLPTRQIAPGETLGITAFWTAGYPVPPADYMTFVHLRNAAGQNVVQRDTPVWQKLFPPATWPPGALVVESLDLQLPEDLPPGEYQLVLGLYDGVEQTRFAAFVDSTPLPNNEVDLGSIVVVAEGEELRGEELRTEN